MHFPRTYAVPRNGKLMGVTVESDRDVRLLRTELELLRRTYRRAKGRSAKRSWKLPTNKQRRELAGILTDAGHPTVEDSIARIDADFVNARKDLTMSVINEEAENIVQEAVESGAIDAMPESTPCDEESNGLPANEEGQSQSTEVPQADATPQGNDEVPNDETSENETAEAVADDINTPNDAAAAGAEDVEPEETEMNAEPAPAEKVDTAPETEPVSECDDPDSASLEDALDNAVADLSEIAELAESELTSEIEPSAEVPDETDATLDAALDAKANEAPDEAMTATDPDDTAPEIADAYKDAAPDNLETPTEASKASEPCTPPACDGDSTTAPQGSTGTTNNATENRSTPSTPMTPEAAAQTASEIEAGIRKLADMLANQVNDQWNQARDALQEVEGMRGSLRGTTEAAETVLSELRRIKEETLISQEEASAACRQAKLHREDAKLAKDRADRSAEAAETAADQARSETSCA